MRTTVPTVQREAWLSWETPRLHGLQQLEITENKGNYLAPKGIVVSQSWGQTVHFPGSMLNPAL